MNEQLARLIPTLASDPGAVAMLGWIFRELETGFAHVADVCDAHLQGRPLPPSLFGRTNPSKPKPARAKPDRANKPKRKPTAYNIFVKRKIEELKAQGFRPDADATGNGESLLCICLVCFACYTGICRVLLADEN